MAAQAQDDYADDVQDPNQVQAGITDQYSKAATEARNSFQLGNAVAAQGGNLIGQGFSQMLGDASIGDPKVVQARRISGAMQQILATANADAPADEDPITKQQRIATAVAAGMANISPQIALKANMQAVAMQEAKNQQSFLTANTAKVKQVTEEDAVKSVIAKTAANYQVHDMVPGKDGLPVMKTYGDPVSLYNPDGTQNQDFSKQIQANLSLAKSQGAQTPQFSTVDAFNGSKLNVALARAQAQAAMADKKAASGMGLTPDAVANSAVLSIVAPNTVTRFSKEDKEAIANFLAKKGISGVDAAAAQSQMKALNSAAVAQGTRVGNITVMEQAISAKGGLGDQVLNALDGVDRTRFPALNAGIIAMKNAAGSGPEARYHTAMQGLITEYARVISGGTGITSDEARKQATDLISKASSPEAVKAVVDQIKNGELKAIHQGSDQAIELIAHPERYGAIVRLQSKAGIPVTAVAGSSDDPSMTQTYSGNVPSTPKRPGQQTPQAASTGWGSAMKVSQ